MRIKGRLFFILSIVVLQFSYAQTSSIKNSFIAPLAIPMYLSGNFAELRPNHFHTGIDIKTKGQIDQPVRSIDDGYLARVYVSPYGYGRALYIRHANGYTSVYGHLHKFSDKISNAVKTIQYEEEQFSIDHQFKPGLIVLKKGEIIGLSGNSGSSGGPHLHFEIRKSSSEKPVNPLLFGFDIKDKVRPQILGIKLMPVNGIIKNASDRSLYQTVYYDQRFHLKGSPTIRAWGEIGIGLQAIDYLSGDWSKCGIREAELFVDGQCYTIYQSDTLAFNELKYINASIDYEEKLRSGKSILKLFKDQPNNRLSNSRPFINRGILKINEERDYHVKIIIRDSHLNQAELTFNITGQRSSITPIIAKPNQQQFRWNKENNFSDSHFSITMNPNLLYNDASFDYHSEASDQFRSNVFTFGDSYTPLHGSAQIKLKPTHPAPLPKQLYVVRLTSKNRKIQALSSVFKNGWVSAKTKQLGRFALLSDSIAPRIKAIEIIPQSKRLHLKSIHFKITDKESGIKLYRGFIDDKWALFEYDAKNSLLSYHLDESRLTVNQQHTLKLEVIDNCGNAQIYKRLFFW